MAAPVADGQFPVSRQGPVRVPDRGYQWGYWVCGHAADLPIGHDWTHRHWCPVCDPQKRDPRCSGVAYRNVTYSARAAATQAVCTLCGAGPARLYPAGKRCQEHAP